MPLLQYCYAYQQGKLHRRRKCWDNWTALLILDCTQLPAVLELHPLDTPATPTPMITLSPIISDAIPSTAIT